MVANVEGVSMPYGCIVELSSDEPGLLSHSTDIDEALVCVRHPACVVVDVPINLIMYASPVGKVPSLKEAAWPAIDVGTSADIRLTGETCTVSVVGAFGCCSASYGNNKLDVETESVTE